MRGRRSTRARSRRSSVPRLPSIPPAARPGQGERSRLHGRRRRGVARGDAAEQCKQADAASRLGFMQASCGHRHAKDPPEESAMSHRLSRRPWLAWSPTSLKVFLTLHIIVSVGLLGDSAGYLAVAIHGSAATDPATARAAYQILQMFAFVGSVANYRK